MNELLIFETENKQVSVRLEGETVWLSQEQMASLFERERSVISKHLRNVFADGELDEKSNVQNLHIAGSDKPTRFYNLDVIISIGYRVKSQRGVRFRQWATGVLREHFTQGYSLNRARLLEKGLDEARQAIDLLARSLADPALISDTGRELIGLIAGYAKTWHLLLKYDEDGLQLPAGCQPARGILDYATARRALDDLQASLHAYGEATDLFARERRACTAFWAASSKPCSASRSTQAAKRRRPTFSISSSRTTRSPTATSAARPSCCCSTYGRKTCQAASTRLR